MNFKNIFLGMTVTVILSGCGEVNMALYEGSPVAQVEFRQLDANKLAIAVQGADEWKLYMGGSEETIDFETPYHVGKPSDEEAFYTLDRYALFVLETKQGREAIGLRHLPMEGGYNFRDLGGYQTTDGSRVKWGKVFRADEMGSLTERDLALLASIPLRTVVDFRSLEEVAESADRLPATATMKELPIVPGNLNNSIMTENVAPEELAGMMREINGLLVTDSVIVGQYKEFFRLLQNPNDAPLLFHCTAGKDRTGLGAALFLSALGVDRETIYEDYLLSNHYLKRKYAALIEQMPALKTLMMVDRSYLETAFTTIEREYGSVEKFLTDVLAVDIEKMDELYLNHP